MTLAEGPESEVPPTEEAEAAPGLPSPHAASERPAAITPTYVQRQFILRLYPRGSRHSKLAVTLSLGVRSSTTRRRVFGRGNGPFSIRVHWGGPRRARLLHVDPYNYASFDMPRENAPFEAFRKSLHVGERAPKFDLEEAGTGKRVSLDALCEGGATILEFGSLT